MSLSCWLVVLLSGTFKFLFTSEFQISVQICASTSSCLKIAPPDPVENWILSACATWPRPQNAPKHSGDPSLCGIYTDRCNADTRFPRDKQYRGNGDLASPQSMPLGFVEHLFSCLPQALLAPTRNCEKALPKTRRQLQHHVAESGLPKQRIPGEFNNHMKIRERTPPRAQSAPGLETLRWCMESLRTARTFQTAPPPSAFAEIVRHMGLVPSGAMLARWQEITTSAPPELPMARAKWLAGLQPDVRNKFHVVLQEDSIWKTMASWRASAAQYASAIQLWGRAALLCRMDPWPPRRKVLDAYAFFFKHGPSLSRYLSHIRFCLALAGSTSRRSCGNRRNDSWRKRSCLVEASASNLGLMRNRQELWRTVQGDILVVRTSRTVG